MKLVTLPGAKQADCLLTTALVHTTKPDCGTAGEAGVTEGQANWGDLNRSQGETRTWFR